MGGQSGVVAVQQRLSPNIEVKKNRYVVLFNLDYSGSMGGKRWSQVCSSVQKFQSMLGDDDLIQGIVFNDTVKTVPHSLRPQITSTRSGNNPEDCKIF